MVALNQQTIVHFSMGMSMIIQSHRDTIFFVQKKIISAVRRATFVTDRMSLIYRVGEKSPYTQTICTSDSI